MHTAGLVVQISDGAAAVLIMTAEKAERARLTPLATIVDTCLVGVDPVLMLDRAHPRPDSCSIATA